MAFTPDSIMGQISLGSFNVFGQAGQLIGNVIIAAILAGLVWFAYQYFFAYTIPVKWVWVRGAEKKKETDGKKVEYVAPQMGGVLSKLNPLRAGPSTISSQYDLASIVPGKQIKDKGKLFVKNNVTYVKLLKGRTYFKYFPKNRYHDGMYCARIDKSTFMPLERPKFGGKGLILEPIDNDIMFWAAMKLQEIRTRLDDDEYKKKSLYVFFGAIIVVCIFAGAVIWMSYSYVNNHTAAQGLIADRLSLVAEKMGLGGPG